MEKHGRSERLRENTTIEGIGGLTMTIDKQLPDVDSFDGDEAFLREVLSRLARQSVAMVLKPGNVLVIQNALEVQDGRMDAALRTCEMRGRITVLHDALPRARLSSDGELPARWERNEQLYRLTEAGWNAIRGTYELTLRVLWVAVGTLILTLIGVVATLVTA